MSNVHAKYGLLLISCLLSAHGKLIGMMTPLDGLSHQELLKAIAQPLCGEQPQARWAVGNIDIICRKEQHFDILDKSTNQLFTFGPQLNTVVEQTWLSKAGAILHIDPYKIVTWGLAVVIAHDSGLIFVNTANTLHDKENSLRVPHHLNPNLGLASVKLPLSARPKYEDNDSFEYRLFAFITPQGEFVVVRRAIEIGWLSDTSHGKWKVFDLPDVKNNLHYIDSFTVTAIKGKEDLRVHFSGAYGTDLDYTLNVSAKEGKGFTMELMPSQTIPLPIIQIFPPISTWPHASLIQEY